MEGQRWKTTVLPAPLSHERRALGPSMLCVSSPGDQEFGKDRYKAANTAQKEPSPVPIGPSAMHPNCWILVHVTCQVNDKINLVYYWNYENQQTVQAKSSKEHFPATWEAKEPRSAQSV